MPYTNLLITSTTNTSTFQSCFADINDKIYIVFSKTKYYTIVLFNKSAPWRIFCRHKLARFSGV